MVSPLMERVTETNPVKENVRFLAVAGTDKLKLPPASVWVPTEPAVTDTPGSGAPLGHYLNGSHKEESDCHE